MKQSIIQIRKARRQKEMAHSRDGALEEYECKQAEIKKILRQISDGLQKHDRNASNQGGHNWTHVGDLVSISETLTDIRDRLHSQGEYAKAITYLTHKGHRDILKTQQERYTR